MKKIYAANGDIITAYELDDLQGDAYDRVITWWLTTEVQIMDERSPLWYLVAKMERLHTPWFLAQAIWDEQKEYVIENIKLNHYLFDEDGEVLPVTYLHKKDGTIVPQYRGKECTLKEL